MTVCVNICVRARVCMRESVCVCVWLMNIFIRSTVHFTAQ